jgi:hypothetical protein
MRRFFTRETSIYIGRTPGFLDPGSRSLRPMPINTTWEDVIHMDQEEQDQAGRDADHRDAYRQQVDQGRRQISAGYPLHQAWIDIPIHQAASARSIPPQRLEHQSRESRPQLFISHETIMVTPARSSAMNSASPMRSATFLYYTLAVQRSSLARRNLAVLSLHMQAWHEEQAREGAREASPKRMDRTEECVWLYELEHIPFLPKLWPSPVRKSS